MLSPRKLKANRRNAAKSTGPRTEEGKRRSARNAVSHGLYCRDIVLDGENEELFAFMRQDFIKTFLPQNLFQLSLVDRIAADQWRLKRLQEAESWLYQMRRQANEQVFERTRERRIAKDERVNRFREKMGEREDAGEEIKKDPADRAMAAAMCSGGITMHSLMGDDECLLDRYERLKHRLEMSISRASRELRLLRPAGAPPPDASPYCDEHAEQIKALARAMDLDVPEDEPEDAEDELAESEVPENAPATSKMKNEATAPPPAATTGQGDACDAAPITATARVAMLQTQEQEMGQFLLEEDDS